jgi:putative phosphoribosyl transferase
MVSRFKDREDAAHRLADELRTLPLVDPLVLAVPRGGVAIGVVIAESLHADLDVVLSRKLRAPHQPELAIGAVCEDGQTYIDEEVARVAGATREYAREEAMRQRADIDRRREIIRRVLPRARVRGRSVILTDDGIATGSTLRAALRTVRAQEPYEQIVAVPVGPRESIDELRRECDRVIALACPRLFRAVGEHFERFEQLDDARMLELLRRFVTRARPDHSSQT